MQILDAMDHEAERKLVQAALKSPAARATLRKLSRELVVRIAGLYRGEGVRNSVATMTNTAMEQFNAVVNEYGERMESKKAVERFSFVLAWWSTRRIEQMLRR
jgi:hypothetical protein